MSKNYIEQVTNLQRETIKYVPKIYFDRLNSAIMSMLYEDSGEEIFDHPHAETLDKIRKEALNHVIEQPIIPDEPEKKSENRPLNICPYCGKKMNLRMIDPTYRPYTYNSINRGRRCNDVLTYICIYCGSRSPWIDIRTDLIDEKKFEDRLNIIIANCVSDYDEDEEDDE